MNESTCACGAAIVRARTEKGLAVVLDAAPDPFGRVVLDAGHAVVYRSASSIQPGRRGRRYAAHADSCPLAREEKHAGLRVLS